MVKWAVDWSEARALQDKIRSNGNIVWAIKMPTDYPECRVTRRGIASIAVTDDAKIVDELREDGGDVQIMP